MKTRGSGAAPYKFHTNSIQLGVGSRMIQVIVLEWAAAHMFPVQEWTATIDQTAIRHRPMEFSFASLPAKRRRLQQVIRNSFQITCFKNIFLFMLMGLSEKTIVKQCS